MTQVFLSETQTGPVNQVNSKPGAGFKVAGGFSKKVCSLLSELLESEEASKATLSATEWSW